MQQLYLTLGEMGARSTAHSLHSLTVTTQSSSTVRLILILRPSLSAESPLGMIRGGDSFGVGDFNLDLDLQCSLDLEPTNL